MRRIGDNINVLKIMQVTKPLGLRLRLRSKLKVKVPNSLKICCIYNK